MQRQRPQFLPTTPLIRRLTQIIVVFTLLVTLLEPIIELPLSTYFSCNRAFFTHSYLWQPITALFYLPETSFNFWSLVDFCSVILLFLALSGQVLATQGKGRFIALYFGSAIFATAGMLLALIIGAKNELISLIYPALLSFITVWTMGSTVQSTVIWMLFPIRPRWLLGLTLLITVGNNLIHGHFVLCAAYCASFLFSYFLAIIIWHESSPFTSLWPMEAALRRRSNAVRRFWNWKVMNWIRTWRRTTTIE